jgi:hypothetical protein
MSNDRVVWMFFMAQSRALWLIRNKRTVESKVITHPADVISKILSSCNCECTLWMHLLRPLDRPCLRRMVSALKWFHAANTSLDV